jgi:hypothetical protein
MKIVPAGISAKFKPLSGRKPNAHWRQRKYVCYGRNTTVLPNANGHIEAELRHNTEGLLKLAFGRTFKVQLVAGREGLSSNFNTPTTPEVPALLVQIPVKSKRSMVRR